MTGRRVGDDGKLQRQCSTDCTCTSGVCSSMRTRARARAPRMLQDFFCGTLMGAVATPAKMPFFVVKTRKQVTVTDSNRL